MLPRLVVLLASMAVLASCSSDPPGTVADAAPDQVLVDTGALDVALDTAPDAGECDPACGSLQVCDRSTRTCVWADAGTDTGSDTGTLSDTSSVNDTGADTSASDTGASDTGPSDSGRDAGDVVDVSDATDTGPSCPGACVLGAMRCGGDAVVQRCERLLPELCPEWRTSRGCLPSASGNPTVCREALCSLCAYPDGGGACGPVCTRDQDCGDRSFGRCSPGGFCYPPPYVRCSNDTDCTVFATTSSRFECAGNVMGVRVCRRVVAPEPCLLDAQCPVGFLCDVTSGFCNRT